MQEKVVIIGSGVTGMAISKSLSAQEIEHVLIGPPPNDSPKLGESINPEGSTELMNQYGDYRECFFDKPLTTIAVGKYKVDCNFSKLRSYPTVDFFLNRLSPGIHIPKEMMHIDRLKFDQKLYSEIRKSPYVDMRDARVSSVDYDKKSDQVTQLHFEGGESIRPKYIFDCTNHARFLGRSLNIPVDFISDKQRVVFCHFHSEKSDEKSSETNSEESCLSKKEWESATNLLRIEKEFDGVEGFAWCIPIGEYISVGMTMNDSEETREFSEEAIVEILQKAYSVRGIKFKNKFPHQSEIISVSGQYFQHEKAFGQNWLLAGPSFGQIWYMSGSGFGAGLTTAVMAPDLVRNPMKAGKAYERYMKEFIKTHWPVDWFINVDHEKISQQAFRKNVLKWMQANINRLAIYPITRRRRWNNFLSKIAYPALSKGLFPEWFFSLSKNCPVIRLAERETMWDSDKLSAYEVSKQTIVQLTETISGQHPLGFANNLLHPRVRLWMDDVPFVGRWFWKSWVGYLRTHSSANNIKLRLESTELHQNVLHMTATWYGVRSSGEDRSEQRLGSVVGRMEVRDGRIIEIHTHKSNYTSLLGEQFDSRFAFLKIFFKIAFWSLFNFKNLVKKYEPVETSI